MSMPPHQSGQPSGATPSHQGPIPPQGPSGANQPGQPQPGQPGGPDPQDGRTGGKGIGKRLLSLLVTVAVLIVALIGYNLVTKWWNQRGMADQVGSCVNVTGSGNNLDTEETDCASPTFHYLVAAAVKSGESCPVGDYTVFTTTQRNRGTTSEVGSLCLMPKLAVDTCYVEQNEGNEVTEGTCDQKALFKVSKVLDEQAPDQCEMPDNAMTFAEPAKTYCLVAAGE